MTLDDEKAIPRSDEYIDKTIKETGYIIIRGIYYFKRIFTDGCAELVRFDWNTQKWAFFCFSNIAE